MDFQTIMLEKNGKIAKLTLNRPNALNALVDPMVDELFDVCNIIENDPDIHVVVLTGAGRAFCAGGDVKEQSGWFSPIQAIDRMHHINQMVARLINLDRPVISMVNGAAVGAGCNIAIAGDIVISAEEAKYSEIFNQVGLIPDVGGMFLLPRRIGLAKAKELVFTGKMITAAEALEMGLVNRVVPLEELEPAVMQLAEELAKGPGVALRLNKRILNKSLSADLETMLEYEAYGQSIAMQSDDHKEGVTAFLEKRKPVFQGK